MESGVGESTLGIKVEIVTPGYVSFNFKMHSFAKGTFLFLKDSEPVIVHNSTLWEWQFSERIPLEVGKHTLEWTFYGGTKVTR